MTTQADRRVYVTFSLATKKWLDEHQSKEGFSSLSGFIASIVDQHVKTKTPDSVELEQEHRPMTPEEEIDKIGEEMGQLNVEYDEKFQAIRSMIPKDAPKVQTAEDLKKRTEFIWKQLLDKNCFVRVRNKPVAISRNDLKCFEMLGAYHLRKKELTAIVETAAETVETQ